MNIYEIFQGTVPIKRIYLNDKTVWKPPLFLLPYWVYLTSHPEGEQILSRMTSVPGNMTSYGEGDYPLDILDRFVSADSILLNEDSIENYASLSIDSAFHALALEQVRRNAVERPIMHTYNGAQDLVAEILHRRDDAYVTEISRLRGLGVTGEILRHNLHHNVLIDMFHKAVDAHGRSLKSQYDHTVFIDENAAALAAIGRIGAHRLDSRVEVTEFHKALAAHAESLLREHNESVAVYDTQAAISAIAEIGRHRANNTIDVGELNYIADAIARIGKHRYHFTVDGSIFGSAMPAISKRVASDKSVISKYHQTGSVCADLSSKRLVIEDTDTADCIADNSLTPLASENVAIEDNTTYTEELSVTRSATEHIAGEVTADITFDDSAVLSTMIWIFPEQNTIDPELANANLHIAQIYDDGVSVGVVQNGSELIFQ